MKYRDTSYYVIEDNTIEHMSVDTALHIGITLFVFVLSVIAALMIIGV